MSIYNIDANGTATGGCFFNAASAGVDYSQQNSPQVTVTDGVANGTTTITSVTGGFTTYNIVGNGVYDSGTSQWYEIITVTDDNTLVVDRNVTTGSGLTFNIGGSLSVFLDAMGTGMAAADRVMVKNGNYSLTETISWAAGTTTSRVRIIGYNTSYSDLATGDDRPNITCGAFELQPQAYNVTIGLRGTFTGTYAIRAQSQHEKVTNCSFEKITASASSAGVATGGDSTIVGCDTIVSAGTSTYGFFANSDTDQVEGCFVKGAATGISAYKSSFNAVSSCTTGILVRADGNAINNTVYDCTIGILLSSIICDALNNDINSCTTGITGNATREEYIDWNNYHSNGTDVTNAAKGANATAVDPNYTDTLNNDFNNDLDPADGMPYGFTGNVRQGAVQSGGDGGIEISYTG